MAKQRKKNVPGHNQPRTPQNTPRTKPAPINWSEWADKYAIYLLGATLAIAFVLRVMNLDDHSLWVDEYVHVNRARLFIDGKSALFTEDNNGILLTVLMLPIFKIFGTEPFWARILSVFFGTGMLWLMYKIGTRLFNRYAGLLAAWFGALSLFLIFWSRMARMYAVFGFFFLLLGWVFLQAWEPDKKDAAEPGQGFWSDHRLSPQYLLLLLPVLFLSLLSHQLTFFFLFIAGFYCLGQLIYRLATKSYNRAGAKYLWVSAGFVPFLLFVLLPGLSSTARSFFSGLALSKIGDFAFPEWTRVGTLWTEKPFEAFNTYVDLLQSDLSVVLWLGCAGLLLAFRHSFRSGWWLFCSTVFPLFLISFIYREPSVQRYAIFIVPYVMIAAGAGCWGICDMVQQKVRSNALAAILLVLPVVLSVVAIQWDYMSNLVLARKLEGHVLDNKISEWAFTNWSEPCDYVKKHGRPGDVVMSTVPNAVGYYLEREDVLWFRQFNYDTGQKKFLPNAPAGAGKAAAGSFEEVVRTVRDNPRGWLLGDYYLDNVFTDEKTLLWVYQNMHFHPEASRNSGVMVFSWDNTKPRPANQNFVVEVGKWEDRVQSRIYTLNLPESVFSSTGIEMQVRLQNVNSNREGLILFNNTSAVWLPPNTGREPEMRVLPLQKEWLQPGANTIQVLYDTDRSKDPVPGFQLYSLAIYGK